MTGKMHTDAQKLAEILLQLQCEFPLFFGEVQDADPDLDLERSFNTYIKIARQDDAG